jgi:hypothetical protein
VGEEPAHKSEEAISLSRSRPLLSDFSKTWFGYQITADWRFRIIWFLRVVPALPSLFRRAVRCKSFSRSIRCNQLPDCFVSSVAGSRDGPCFTLSYWRIAPPLIRKILRMNCKITGCGSYIFVEIASVLWKYG